MTIIQPGQKGTPLAISQHIIFSTAANPLAIRIQANGYSILSPEEEAVFVNALGSQVPLYNKRFPNYNGAAFSICDNPRIQALNGDHFCRIRGGGPLAMSRVVD